MNIRRYFRCILGVLVFYCSGCESDLYESPTPPDLANENWYEVTAEDQSFHALLPFEPEIEETELDSEFGKIRAHGWSCADTMDGACQYFVVQFDYLEDITDQDPDKFLDEAIERAVRVYEGELKSKKRITLDDQPGRDFLYEASTGKHELIARQRIFLVDSTLYQTLILSRETNQPSVEVIERFHESFHLQNKP